VIFLKVNKLSSVKTQLPYEYYSLPYCRPEKIVPFAENLGEVLRGDRIENSLYQVSAECLIAVDRWCHCVGTLCSPAGELWSARMQHAHGSFTATDHFAACNTHDTTDPNAH